jgi:hypothetical protein
MRKSWTITNECKAIYHFLQKFGVDKGEVLNKMALIDIPFIQKVIRTNPEFDKTSLMSMIARIPPNLSFWPPSWNRT